MFLLLFFWFAHPDILIIMSVMRMKFHILMQNMEFHIEEKEHPRFLKKIVCTHRFGSRLFNATKFLCILCILCFFLDFFMYSVLCILCMYVFGNDPLSEKYLTFVNTK